MYNSEVDKQVYIIFELNVYNLGRVIHDNG